MGRALSMYGQQEMVDISRIRVLLMVMPPVSIPLLRALLTSMETMPTMMKCAQAKWL